MTKETLKRKSAKLGHQLGRFETRRYMTPGWQHGRVMYRVAWCKRCAAAAFTDDETSPALSRSCHQNNEVSHE